MACHIVNQKENMSNLPLLVVWDFDGVLNANHTPGPLAWAERITADLGLDKAAFARFFSDPVLVREVLRGRWDLHDAVTDWLKQQGSEVAAETVLNYWFEKDARPDPEVIGWLEAHPARKVIGTNNETHRARYIEDALGFGDRVEKMFSSGRMGVAKPDQGFFAEIERWSGLAPPQILLVDDLPANIAAATKRGWQGFHFTPHTRATLPERLGLV